MTRNRINPRLSTWAVGALLILGLAVAGLWGFSYARVMGFELGQWKAIAAPNQMRRDAGYVWAGGGRVSFIYYSRVRTFRSSSHLQELKAKGLYTEGTTFYRFVQKYAGRPHYAEYYPKGLLWRYMGIRFKRTSVVGGPGPDSQTTWNLVLPYWLLFAGLTTWPGYCLYRRWRKCRHVEAGLCKACGYDLRCSAGHCPECGAAISRPATAPHAT